jgi:hypothetical protein
MDPAWRYFTAATGLGLGMKDSRFDGNTPWAARRQACTQLSWSMRRLSKLVHSGHQQLPPGYSTSHLTREAIRRGGLPAHTHHMFQHQQYRHLSEKSCLCHTSEPGNNSSVLGQVERALHGHVCGESPAWECMWIHMPQEQ